jgi:hypothetical protein
MHGDLPYQDQKGYEAKNIHLKRSKGLIAKLEGLVMRSEGNTFKGEHVWWRGQGSEDLWRWIFEKSEKGVRCQCGKKISGG